MDFFTSGVMIRLRGAGVEGNPVVRAMFENPNVTTIGAAIEQQYAWLGLMIFGLLSLQLIKHKQRIHSRRLKELAQTVCTVGVVLVWPFAVLRLYSGAIGNLLQIVALYGMTAQVMVVVVASAAIVVAVVLEASTGRYFSRR
jgi:drug/metabolite transporter (DMT)-like permease